MKIYTNMAWPGDPYRTGQQLYRRPAPRLAAFAVGRAGHGSRLACHSAAVVYLPLHRTRSIAVTGQTLAFGFRAATTSSEGLALARLADLDLLQARRHAAVLAGHRLAADLVTVRSLAPGAALRGVDAVSQEWADRGAPAKGRAAMADCGLDPPGGLSLNQACRAAGIRASAGALAGRRIRAAGDQTAALAVERALVIALVCARHPGRYHWEGILPTEQILIASAWDCFQHISPADNPALPNGQPGNVPAARTWSAGR
jgi:hypothetical protein